MNRFFPLSQIPPRKFNFGDRVESLDDTITEGTIFGYQYQHVLWLDQDLHINRSGWIYTVLQTYNSGSQSCYLRPFITHFHEDELALIEGYEHTEIALNQQMLSRLFGSIQPIFSLLQCCSVYISGIIDSTEIIIDCGNDEELASKIWSLQSTLRAILKAWGLTQKACIKVNQRIAYLLQSKFEISPTIKIPVIMENNNDIIIRAQRHQHLLQAIQHAAVAVTLHDANEASEFIYLDILVDHPERLNVPKHLLIGQPAFIVDPSIAEPRIHYIKKALANGQCETYQYHYDDKNNGVIWRFDVSVTPIPGSEEVITIVKDSDPWQRYFWLNRLN